MRWGREGRAGRRERKRREKLASYRKETRDEVRNVKDGSGEVLKIRIRTVYVILSNMGSASRSNLIKYQTILEERVDGQEWKQEDQLGRSWRISVLSSTTIKGEGLNNDQV